MLYGCSKFGKMYKKNLSRQKYYNTNEKFLKLCSLFLYCRQSPNQCIITTYSCSENCGALRETLTVNTNVHAQTVDYSSKNNYCILQYFWVQTCCIGMVISIHYITHIIYTIICNVLK